MAAFSVVSKKSGKTYFLHQKDVKLRGGRMQRIYYFATQAKDNAIDALPAGYQVMETSQTGLPVLKKG